MKRRQDLTNQVFGRLTVLGLDENLTRVRKVGYWRCQCKCGNIKSVAGYHLKRGNIRSCGCLLQETNSQTHFHNDYTLYGNWALVTDAKGHEFKVSIEDLPLIQSYYWSVNIRRDNYVFCNQGKMRGIALHRFLYGLQDWDKQTVVDHINHDCSDNRKQNLRIATYRENMGNRGKMPYNTNEYKGITAYKTKTQGIRYRARIRYKGKQLNLGTYSTPEEAAKVYNAKAIEVFGEFALLNKIKGE